MVADETVDAPEVDDVPDEYPVPEPMEVPDDVDFTDDDDDEAEEVVDELLTVKEEDGWCGRIDYKLVSGDTELVNEYSIGEFLRLVKDPAFDQFVANVRAGKYDKAIS